MNKSNKTWWKKAILWIIIMIVFVAVAVCIGIYLESHGAPENGVFKKEGWSLFGYVSVLIALGGTISSIITLIAQQNVEKHTKNVSVTAQVGALKDLLRHLHRNATCTGAILYKFREKANTGNIDNTDNTDGTTATTATTAVRYPSEANMFKLLTPPETYVLTIDVIDDDVYKKMSELRKLLQNYNCEIEIATKHFATKGMDLKEDTELDFSSLLFKPLFLSAKALDLLAKLEPSECTRRELKKRFGKTKPEDRDYVPEVFYAIVGEHLSKLKPADYSKEDLTDVNKLFSLDNKTFYKTIYGHSDHIKRGFNTLSKLLSGGKQTTPDGVFEWSCSNDIKVNREAFIKRYCEIFDIEQDKWNESIDELKNKINEHILKHNLPENAFKEYFDLWEKKQWDLYDFYLTILKMDIALEYDKIGMIKFR